MDKEKTAWDINWDHEIPADEIGRLFQDDLYYYANNFELLPYGSSSIKVQFRVSFPLDEGLKTLDLEEDVVISGDADYHNGILELSDSALDELKEKLNGIEEKLLPLFQNFKEGYTK